MSSQFNSNGNDNFSIMQHLIDEMDASNHRIDMFSQKFDEDLNEYNDQPPRRPSKMERQFEALYDDTWKSEESDVASLQEVPAHLSNDAEDSGCEEAVNSAIAEVSNDFLSGFRQTAAQAQYADSDESRISSDNDFKILRGMASYARYPETTTGLSDTDWNPYGTESDNNQSPRLQPQENASDSKSSLFTSFTPLLNSTDINTVTPSSGVRLPQLNDERMSDILERTERESTLNSHLTQNTRSDLFNSDSTVKQLYSPAAIRRPPEKALDVKKGNDALNSKEALSSDEERKLMASTSSTGYSSAPTSVKVQDNEESTAKPLSVIERAKLMGVPEEILLDKRSTTKLSKTGEFHRKFCNSPEVVSLSDDQLGQKVKALLSDTSHLSTYDKTDSSSSVDYTVLQRDLQEIQDNLDNFGSTFQGRAACGRETNNRKCKSQGSSEGEGDIIPSTTTTPEKRKEKMLWDFAGDLGYLSEQPGLMAEISLDTRSSSNRPSTEKPLYNSDGDETRTSESSAKNEDHAAADQALADMCEIIPPSMRCLDTSNDVDKMVSNFQNQRRQLESRYEQLNNQGLAEKVFRILTNQNPESQANGILSEISADEKDMRTRLVLDLKDRNFNYSSASSWLDDVNQSFNRNLDVKKRLDLSGSSSRDSSLMVGKPTTKGFSAIDDAKRLLSSQMMKASERTFNHSIDLRVPQTIQCYPLFVGDEDEHETKNDERHEMDRNEMENDASPHQTVDQSLDQHKTDSNIADEQEVVDDNRSNTPPSDPEQRSVIRSKDKYLPYRPPGSKQVYYIESDTASVADSVTTMESTHFGSDDARGPSLPSHAFGSRRDPPSAGSGIYSSNNPNLSTVCEDTETGPGEEKNEKNDSKKVPQSNNPSHKTSTKKEDDPVESYADKRGGASSIEVARRDAKWALRRQEISKDDQNTDTKERRSNIPPSVDGIERRTYTSPTYGTDRMVTRGVDIARRDAKWALRNEEVVKDGQVSQSERRRNASPSQGVDAAERSHRDWGIEREGRAFELERRRVTSPTNAIEAVRRDARWSHRTDEIDKEVSGVNEDTENEPMSLRIRMTYSDDKNGRDKMKDFERDDQRQRYLDEREQMKNVQPSQPVQRDASNMYGRCSPELRNAFISSYSQPDYDHKGHVFRAASDENLYSRHGRLSPAFRSALDSGLIRAGSDENLNVSRKDARLSPAFRRALSPELRNSIERRSPLLSKHLERSLAQPPSQYPRFDDDVVDARLDRRGPPTFLARERSLSPPASRTRQPIHHNFDSVSKERPSSSNGLRSVSPPYLERISRRIGSPTGRQNEAEIFESARGSRVLDSIDQSIIKSKRKVELTLEGMSSESDADLEVDQEPLTKRTQLLKAALSNEAEPHIRQDIRAMWERFKAMNESGNSSINSSKMEAVAGLLKSPSRHLVSQYVKDREEYRLERQERAEFDREKRLREQQQMQKHSSSEDEINERYVELLALKEEERVKRRTAKKKKGKTVVGAPTENRNGKDNLFSIPEDGSHDPSPSKPNTPSSKHQKSKSTRQSHMIDPNMFKLRERIEKQKTKVDKDKLKEMRRVEKLKKLESLLCAKKSSKISNETLESHLDELSSTSAIASDSHDSCTDIPSNWQALSDDSTTAKDSSAEMHAWKAEKERRKKLFQLEKQQTAVEKKTHKEKNGYHSKKSSHPSNSKTSPDVSEIRLLKLVKEGYLTAAEAYKLAIDRASQDGLEALNSSNNSDNGWSGKRHQMYSPYSRSSDHTAQARPIPKLKSSGPVQHSSYRVRDEGDLHDRYIHDKERKLEGMLSEQRHRARSRAERRAKSHSPSHGMTYSPVRREKSFSPSSKTRSTCLTSTKPHYSTQGSHDPFYSKKAKRNLQESKKCNSENDIPGRRKDQDMRESVAWHIPMDLPPSQWKGPIAPHHKRANQTQQPLREVTSSITNTHRRIDQRSETAPRFYNTERGSNVENWHQGFERGDNSDDNVARDSIWTKSDHPRGIPKLQWEQVMSSDVLASKTNHCEVDPLMDRVQYVLNRPNSGSHCYQAQGNQSLMSNDVSQDSDAYEKPIAKMSLQEAFMVRKQRFISKCSERQKRLKLAKDDRQLQECLRLEREAIFAEQQRLAPPNLYAHPYSDNLHQPKHRILTKHEMKSLTAKRYNKLPEVVGKKEDDKKKIEAKLNRLRASLFNKKVQRDVLRKSLSLRC